MINDIFDLADLGLLSIAGSQSQKFLQGQLTCHLDEVTPSQARLGAHCNPQGRIISLFRIFMYHDDYFLQMPRTLIPIAMQALQKYAVFFKVTLTDVSDQYKQFGCIEYIPQAIELPGSPARYLLIDQKNTMTAARTDYNRWKSIDMAQHIPAIYPDTCEKFLPHDLDLLKHDAVSFNKGCYTGQEIIARMQYRGKIKNHLYRATVKTSLPLMRGADIYCEGKSCGQLVDFCQIDCNSVELLVIAGENDITTRQFTLDPDKKIVLEFLWQKNYAL